MAEESLFGAVAALAPGGHGAPAIEVDDVAVVYDGGGFRALDGVSLCARRGEFLSIIGPSGCGKTTLLRLVADLLAPSRGQIRVDGRTPGEARRARRVGFVFQAAALLEWRSALANVRMPLELAGVGRAEAARRARAMLELVGLQEFADRSPHELSGGMQQRVSIARSLVTKPDVLLMDEPFGALDEITRDRLNLELLRICAAARPTVLFVTHNIREAVLLSDRVLIMAARPGRIVAELTIELPRPRTVAQRALPEFNDYVLEGQRQLEAGFEPLLASPGEEEGTL